MRLTVPKAATGEIIRLKLVESCLDSREKLVYVHGGAGYGKTTLLSQIANSAKKTIWLSLAGENDILSFVDTLCEAIRQSFPDYDFIVSEYLPFAGKENFTTLLANALISSIERLPGQVILILDDLHTIKEGQVRALITCFIKYAPDNIRLCLGSRTAPWEELIPMRVRGNILEINQQELAFTWDEAVRVLGPDHYDVYRITEGWPLAIRSFSVLLENGVSPAEVPSRGNEALHAYLFYECISRLPSEMVGFLKDSACFEELDVEMLDSVLYRKNSKTLLETLVLQNMFTIKTVSGYYRYHSLLREYLLESGEASQRLLLQHRAAEYYVDKKEYSRAAEFAMLFEDKALLGKIILACYRGYMKAGKNYSELRVWFQALGDEVSTAGPEILVAKGAFLSSIGNFTEAKTCLDAAIPLLNEGDRELYFEAMVHKARVLRNFVSFEESNRLLDELITKLDDPASEISYAIVIEKLYNLCWNSQIKEAYEVASRAVEACSRAGNIKVKAWFERYLSAIHFFAGKMKESVYYYEKSLELPEDELQYLDTHNIGIYVAKAYQMLGDRSRSLSLLSSELQKLRSTGKYEEMWSGYLFAAEIHYQNTFIDRMNGQNQTFETTIKYFTLADEYAPLYRKTEFQMQWAKMQRLTYSLMFTNNPKEPVISEIFADLHQAPAYLQTIILARLFGYFAAVSDFSSAVKCARMCIEIGEKANLMMLPALAYGILARAAIATGDHEGAIHLTKRYLQLCFENGLYEYFRMRKDYDLILAFAFDNGIEPVITAQMMAFAGYTPKKVYIETLGSFTVFPYQNREEPLKMRTKKERELLAFLFDAGAQGVTKEQIYRAIWSESESEDVKKLIGVNLTHIKKDLAQLGMEDLILSHGKHYSICRDKIECDFELFEKAAAEFKLRKNRESAQKLMSLYKGEYLSDFEAFWATAKRIQYRQMYEEAVEYCL